MDPAHVLDPVNLDEINARVWVWAENQAAIRPVAIERIVIEEQAFDALVEVVCSQAGQRVCVVCDSTVIHRQGQELKPLLEELLAHRCDCHFHDLSGDRDGTCRADLSTAKRLARELHHYGIVVSVGSGTVTDIVKYARHLAVRQSAAQLPFVCFPTAASMTAYTSALAVLNVEGVKRTLPAEPPDVIICDLATLADAPLEMTRAGFGDVLARSVSYGDWFLANELGMSETYSRVPGVLLEHAERSMIDGALGLAARDPESTRRVLDSILLAGMAMSLVNDTAPLSGWEHVISHYLDLTASLEGRHSALHGAQVGMATLVSARAYERYWPELDLNRVASPLSNAGMDAFRKRIEAMFQPYDDSGRLVAEIWRDYQQKLNRWKRTEKTRRLFAERKEQGEFDDFIGSRVRTSREIREALFRAGAPHRFQDLNPPVPDSAAHAALLNAHLIRSRFTFGDLLDHCGVLNKETATALCEH